VGKEIPFIPNHATLRLLRAELIGNFQFNRSLRTRMSRDLGEDQLVIDNLKTAFSSCPSYNILKRR